MPNIHCVVESAEGGITFRWWHGQDAFPVYAFAAGSKNLRALDKAADGCRRAFEHEVLPGVLRSGADGAEARAGYRVLAETGFALRERLFDPTGDTEPARRVASWLQDLRALAPGDDPVTIEVVNEADRPVPWNLIYDDPLAPGAFGGASTSADWEPFWAVRYNVFGGRRVDPRRRRALLGSELRVLVLTDPAALDGLDDQRAWLDRFAANGRTRVLTRSDELPDALKGGRPDVLYCLCHTAESGLQLDGGPLDPDDLFDLLGKAGGRDVPGGLVFLNACRSAVPKPGEASFWRNVFDTGMSGLIGTEHDTLNTFAAPLGARFLDEFCNGGKTAGAVMRGLRADPAYRPFSLLYAANCPPEFRVAGASGHRAEPAPSAPGASAGDAMPLRLRRETERTVELPVQPYPRLGTYTRADRALFAGRDRDVLRFAHVLDQPDCRMLVLHSESGVGKSSFLAAGLIPYLEGECVGYRFERRGADTHRAASGQGNKDDPILFVRATDDLTARLGEALTEFVARPATLAPGGHEHCPDLRAAVRPLVPGGDIGRALVADPALCGRLLAAVGAALPYRPVLILDQAEEVFTLVRSATDTPKQERALILLRSLAEAEGNFAVIVGLRTEYFGRLVDKLRTGVQQAAGVREYLLTDLDRTALVDAITRPTRAEPLPGTDRAPRAVWGFRYEPGVAEEIAERVLADTTNRHDSALPLAQIICGQLYDQVKEAPATRLSRWTIWTTWTRANHRAAGCAGGSRAA